MSLVGVQTAEGGWARPEGPEDGGEEELTSYRLVMESMEEHPNVMRLRALGR